jgi:hypothetical protein
MGARKTEHTSMQSAPTRCCELSHRHVLAQSLVRSPHPHLLLPGVPPAARLRLACVLHPRLHAVTAFAVPLHPRDVMDSRTRCQEFPHTMSWIPAYGVAISHPRDARVIPIRAMPG